MKNSSDSSHNQFDARQITLETGIARLEMSESLPSTNDLAKALAKQAASDTFPLIVLTRNQTQGRGQGDHRWFAGTGSLTFSLAIAQNADVEAPGLIPASVAVAVCEAIEATTGLSNVKIKWPNDILIDERKVGGILIESVVSNVEPLVPRLVVGIGINVNNSVERLDTEVLFPPVSLLEAVEQQIPLTDLLIATVRSVLGELSHPDLSQDRYNQRSFINGKRISIVLPDSEIVHGIAAGITDCGGLLISPVGAFGGLSEPITVVSGQICQIEYKPNVL